jgi:mannose-6-phosphate isomerase
MENTEEINNSPVFDRRPWGTFHVLDEAEGFKVKRIEVLPNKRLSYQKHAHRAEHWFVVQGTAKVTLNGDEILVKTGEAIDIPLGTAHRVENSETENLIFIEVQRGGYLGEDDIERLEDDFGRN